MLCLTTKHVFEKFAGGKLPRLRTCPAGGKTDITRPNRRKRGSATPANLIGNGARTRTSCASLTWDHFCTAYFTRHCRTRHGRTGGIGLVRGQYSDGTRTVSPVPNFCMQRNFPSCSPVPHVRLHCKTRKTLSGLLAKSFQFELSNSQRAVFFKQRKATCKSLCFQDTFTGVGTRELCNRFSAQPLSQYYFLARTIAVAWERSLRGWFYLFR